jgi:hypothetical protein
MPDLPGFALLGQSAFLALADKDWGGKAWRLRENVTSFPQFIRRNVTIRLR